MKKILLIAAVVLCIAVASTALAIEYNDDASPITGELQADSFLKLSLERSSATADIVINPGKAEKYTIQCDVTSMQATEANPKTGTLTITLADGADGDLDDVTIALFDDPSFTDPVLLNATTHAIDDENGVAATMTGAGSIQVTGLSANKTIYVRLSVPSNMSEDAAADCEGSMTISLVKAN